MIYRLLADAVMLMHFAFVAFLCLGGLLLLLRRRTAWVHVPLVLYGAGIEFIGWICPLTPLEQYLRRQAGTAGYGGGFLDHYLRSFLYPTNWSSLHTVLGIALLAGNVVIYGLTFTRIKARSRAHRFRLTPSKQ